MSVHLWVYLIKVNFQIILLFFIKHAYHASCNLPYFIIDSYKIRICTICSFAIIHFHLFNVSQHSCYQNVVWLIYFSKIKKLKENYVLKDPILFTKVPFFEHLEHSFNQLINSLENYKKFSYLKILWIWY